MFYEINIIPFEYLSYLSYCIILLVEKYEIRL